MSSSAVSSDERRRGVVPRKIVGNMTNPASQSTADNPTPRSPSTGESRHTGYRPPKPTQGKRQRRCDRRPQPRKLGLVLRPGENVVATGQDLHESPVPPRPPTGTRRPPSPWMAYNRRGHEPDRPMLHDTHRQLDVFAGRSREVLVHPADPQENSLPIGHAGRVVVSTGPAAGTIPAHTVSRPPTGSSLASTPCQSGWVLKAWTNPSMTDSPGRTSLSRKSTTADVASRIPRLRADAGPLFSWRSTRRCGSDRTKSRVTPSRSSSLPSSQTSTSNASTGTLWTHSPSSTAAQQISAVVDRDHHRAKERFPRAIHHKRLSKR